MTFTFQKAERKKSRLRLGITGASGSGKTYGSLLIAKGIGGKVAVLDTEKGSASLYSNVHDFDVLELQAPYTPERFIAAIDAAENANYDILIIDSITHEWNGSGGCLELNDEIAASKYRGNTWSAWNETNKRHRAFLDRMLQSKMHIICTIRSKTETAQQESITGKKTVVKLGMKAEQRDGVEYELTTVLDIVHDGHYALASKDRTGLFVDKDPKAITVKTGEELLRWLEKGIEVQPEMVEDPEEAAPAKAKKPKQVEQDDIDFMVMIQACKSMGELAACWQLIPANEKKDYEQAKNEQKELLTNGENA